MTNRSYVSHISTKVCLAVFFPLLLGLGCAKIASLTPTASPTPTATAAAGPAAVSLSSDHSLTVNPADMGSIGNYVIFGQSLVSTTGATTITGNVGISPAAASFITGFSLVADGTNVFSTSSLVVGKVYASDFAPPTPANVTTAQTNSLEAYTDAAGRTSPTQTELGAGAIGSLNIAPGLYKWGTDVSIATNVTLTGGANSVWIFQIAGNLTVASGVSVILAGGAQAKNIFWQVGGLAGASLGTTSNFKGIILAAKDIAFLTGATLTGRAISQTQVTLDANTITQP